MAQQRSEWIGSLIDGTVTMGTRALVGAGLVIGLPMLSVTLTPVAVPLIMLGTSMALEVYSGIRKSGREQRDLLSQFDQEVAAKTGKRIRDIDVDDLHDVAYGNRKRGIIGNGALRQALEENNARTLSGWMTSTLAFTAVATIGMLVPFGGDTLFNMLTSGGTGLSLGAITGNLGSVIGGITLGAPVVGAAMAATKMLMSYVTDGITGTSKQFTLAERLEQIEHAHKAGQTVTPQQVMGVIVAADVKLAAEIKARTGGRSYDELSTQEQAQVIANFNQADTIEQLTGDINRGNIRVTELAFAARGQTSGVPYDHDPKDHKSRGKEWDFSELLREIPEMAAEGAGIGALGGAAVGVAGLVADNYNGANVPPPKPGGFAEKELQRRANAPTQQSFVEQVGGSRLNGNNLSHVQMLAARREQERLMQDELGV